MDYNFIVTQIDRIIYVAGDEFTENDTSFDAVLRSNELIFHLPEPGDGELKSVMVFGGREYEIRSDMIRLLPKGEHGTYEICRKKRGAGCIDIFFQTDRPMTEEVFCLYDTHNQKIAELFRHAFTTWVAKGEGYYQECLSCVYRILAEMQKVRYLPAAEYGIIQPAIDYIDAHFRDEKLNMEILASQCGISYSALKRMFIKRFGLPPQKYVTNMRMNYAGDLLKTGEYSVEAVAQLTGYSTVYYFSRQFKKQTGLTPSEFRRKYRSSR